MNTTTTATTATATAIVPTYTFDMPRNVVRIAPIRYIAHEQELFTWAQRRAKNYSDKEAMTKKITQLVETHFTETLHFDIVQGMKAKYVLFYCTAENQKLEKVTARSKKIHKSTNECAAIAKQANAEFAEKKANLPVLIRRSRQIQKQDEETVIKNLIEEYKKAREIAKTLRKEWETLMYAVDAMVTNGQDPHTYRALEKEYDAMTEKYDAAENAVEELQGKLTAFINSDAIVKVMAEVAAETAAEAAAALAKDMAEIEAENEALGLVEDEDDAAAYVDAVEEAENIACNDEREYWGELARDQWIRQERLNLIATTMVSQDEDTVGEGDDAEDSSDEEAVLVAEYEAAKEAATKARFALDQAYTDQDASDTDEGYIQQLADASDVADA